MTDAAEDKQTIILVDDDVNILNIMARIVMFVASDYTVLPLTNAAEALEAFALHNVPLLITDYNMPGMNGLELLREIKARSPKTAVALVTAFFSPELYRQASELGAEYMLPKPMTIDQIEQVVQEVLGLGPTA